MPKRAGRRPQKILPCLAAAIALLASAPARAAGVFQPKLIASMDYAGDEVVRVFVRDIRFILRVEHLAEDQLKPLLADLVGRELAVEEIRQALPAIARHCAGKGHPVRPILPQQSFADGVVRIVVAEGRPEPADSPLPPLDDPLLDRGQAAQVAGKDKGAARKAAAHEQRLVTDIIAARYRVTRKDVEPVVATAYRAGKESAVDPLLILAVIAVESSFDPVAVSVVGAKGLMQVMPKFHMDKIALHGDEEVLFDPKTNILVGSKILREYLRRFGETVAALQMYVGASNDPSFAYARRVLTERSVFERSIARLRRAT